METPPRSHRSQVAIKGINPIEEKFTVAKAETTTARIYLLKGKKTTLLLLRDKMNNWESELEKGIAPGVLQGVKLNLRELGIMGSPSQIEVYDPWKNKWTSAEKAGDSIILPDFKRSIVVRLHSK